MKTATDSAAAGAGATVALLNGGADFQMIDLYKITLNGGAVIRWHGGPFNTPIGFAAASGQATVANGSYAAGPVLDRGKITTKIGLEVATFDLQIGAGGGDLINGTPLIPFAQGRGFDGATIVLYRGFIPAWGQPINGVVIAFSGRVTALKDVSRSKITMTISAWTVLLNVNMGPDVFQAGCLNTHYDADCGLTPVNVTGAVAAGPASISGFATNLANPDHYFDKGILTFTSGANAGVSRAVQTYLNAGGAMAFSFGFPAAPAPGDTFNAVRGCLLTMADCTAQGNLVNFRGQPFTPPAVTGVS
jgi:hypothetical protein